MRRRYGKSLVRPVASEEDVNPSAYVSNLADCMLVLVLGLLVALVARYGLDLTEPEEEEGITGIEVNLDEDDDGEVDDAYQARGTVYYDEKTGNYYFVAD